MGDDRNDDLRVDFDRRLKLNFLGAQITTDAGLLAYLELDEAFAPMETAATVSTTTAAARTSDMASSPTPESLPRRS